MRVLLLTMNPNLGASARVLQDWLREARSGGIEMLVVVRQVGDLTRWLASEGIAHQVNDMPWLDRTNCLAWIRSVARLKSFTRGRRIDVLHCYEDELWPFAWPLRFLFRAATICHFHFLPSPRYARWAFASSWKQPQRVLWVSHHQQADAAAAVAGVLRGEQAVVPLGVDLERFGQRHAEGERLRREWGIAKGEILVAGACALRPGKRIDEFIEVSRRVLHCWPNVKIALAGAAVTADGNYGEHVSQQLTEMQTTHAGRFLWLGHVEPIEPVLHAADIVLSTSEYETFGMSNCEAMACGKPVVAYASGAVPEVVGETGLLFPIGDIAGLTAGVGKLVVDAELRQSLGHSARQRVAEHFNPRKSFDQLRGIYESLIAGRNSKKSAVAAL